MNNKHHTVSSTNASTVYGSIKNIKLPKFIVVFPYRYRFCGFPIGVNILPKLAAIVSMVIIHIYSLYIVSKFTSKVNMYIL